MLGSLRIYLSTALLAGVLVLASTGIAFAGEPTDFVKKNATQVSELLRQKDSAKRHEQFSAKLNQIVDFRELASRALGEHWQARTAEEQQTFLDLLREMLEANYRNKLEGNTLGEDYQIEYLEEKTRDKLAIVKTRIKWDSGEETADYKLIQKDDGWIVYDTIIDDISLVETYRESYTQIIKDDGWDALIRRMRERAKELRTQNQ
ncbi:MAG: MlaC/ttg2D family ABC transporter substrate-binding protein [Persicimonas sp.]